MQDYKTEHPFDITLSEEQQMTWDMLRKFAETELRPQARQAETDGRPSDELLEKIKSLDLISLIIPEAYRWNGLRARFSFKCFVTGGSCIWRSYPWLCQYHFLLLTAKIIVEHGSEEQKADTLPESC